MNNLSRFLQYHNAVPIALGVLFLGAGATFAASDPGAIFSATEEIISIDNTYLVGKDLASYTPRALITGVSEDADTYYVEYELHTIDLSDGVWRDVKKSERMAVSKADLGPYRDLGVYVTQQLRQNVDRELSRLHQTQEIERKQVSQKVVATTYGGLVGKLLDTSTVTLPGYQPVVEAPTSVSGGLVSTATPGDTTSAGASGDTAPAGLKVGLQLLGNNPARIPLGANYIDLGAVLIDPYQTNIGVYVFVDGAEVTSPSIDTATTSARTIEYRATDPSGEVLLVRRIVLIGDAIDPGTGVSEAGNVHPVASPASTPTTEPEPPASPEATQGTATSEPEPAPTPEQEVTVTSTSTTDIATSSDPSGSGGGDTLGSAATSTDETSLPSTVSPSTDATSTQAE